MLFWVGGIQVNMTIYWEEDSHNRANKFELDIEIDLSIPEDTTEGGE